MAVDLTTASACDIADGVRADDIKAAEVLDHYLARIEDVEPLVNAWVATDVSDARHQAEVIDRAVASGDDPGLLAGVPIGVKDVDELRGFATTWGSLVHADDPVAEADGHHIARLRRAGVVFIGKTTTSEFGSAGFTSTKLTGTTHSPWKLDRTPGGSSGGSAAAVAAGMVPLSTGGDGGGSIRLPCAYSGVVGVKATSGRIPMGPARGDWSRCVQRGPIGRTVRDSARYVDAASGMHPLDRNTYIGGPTQLEAAIESLSLEGKKVVWTDTMGFGVSDPKVSATVRRAVDALIESAGLVEVERELTWPDPGLAWLVHMALELGAELHDYVPDRIEEFTPIVQMSLRASTEFITPRQIADAIDLRLDFERQTAEFFEDVDLLVTPTAPDVAYDAGGPMPTQIAGEEVELTSFGAFTYPFNLSGNPGISVPAGLVDGLPVGLQIVGRYCRDDEVIAAAAAFESVAPPWQPAPDPFPE